MRDPQVDKVIELYAYFASPASAYKTLVKEYGENALTANAVKRIRENYRQEILAKRKDLEATIPLLDMNERWAALQEIIDGALAGDTIINRQGTYIKYDRLAALKALQLANDFASTKGTVNTDDDDLVRSIVQDAYKELKAEKPDVKDEEILKEIEETLGEKVRPFVSEIKTELNV